MLDPDVRRALGGTDVAHLATVMPDRSPHSVPLWVGTHGDHVVFLTGTRPRKARNPRRDPRFALSLAPAENPFQTIIVRGRIVEDPCVWCSPRRRQIPEVMTTSC